MRAWWNERRGKGRPKGLTPENLSKVVNLLPDEGELPFKELSVKGKKLYGFHHTTLLRYLKYLVDIGFVSETHRGKRVFYRKLFPALSSPPFDEYLAFRLAWHSLFPPTNRSSTVRLLRHHLLTLPQIAGDILKKAQKVPKEKREEFIRTMEWLFFPPLLEAIESWGKYDLPEEVLREAEEPIKRAMYETVGFWYRDEKEELLKLLSEREGDPLLLLEKFLEAKYGKKALQVPGGIAELLRRPGALDGFVEYWEKRPREFRRMVEKMRERERKIRELIKGFIRREYPEEWREIYAKWEKWEKESTSLPPSEGAEEDP